LQWQAPGVPVEYGRRNDPEARVTQRVPQQETNHVGTFRTPQSAAVLEDGRPGRRRAGGGAVRHSRLGPGQGRRRRPQRSDYAGRHRHRQPRRLRPGLFPPGAGRAVPGHLRREGRPAHGRQENGRLQVRQPGLRDVPRFPRTAGPARHRRRPDRHRSELARDGGHRLRQGRQGRLLREALHEEHRAEPHAGRDFPPHGPRLSGWHAAEEPAAVRVRR
jgi:hypothetical protein